MNSNKMIKTHIFSFSISIFKYWFKQTSFIENGFGAKIEVVN